MMRLPAACCSNTDDPLLSDNRDNKHGQFWAGAHGGGRDSDGCSCTLQQRDLLKGTGHLDHWFILIIFASNLC